MNGYAPSRTPYGYGPGLPPPQSHGPKPRALVDGYTKEIMNDFEGDAPRHNPLNPERPQSSALVDLKDPIQVHLLTETALTDSKTYEILSQEEVDDIKKEIQFLSQRIEQARTNLTIQSKYRDAAVSMSKLYSPGKQDAGKRKSLLNRASGGEHAREAEKERQAVEHKCEELAAELWGLEKRLIEPQRRLLEHTAGVLQMTHNSNKKPTQQGVGASGIPGSPESLYTWSNGRNSVEPGDDLYFDEQGLFQSLDSSAMARGGPRMPPTEPPLRSPQREQAAQLREENEQLKAHSDALAAELDTLRNEDSGRLRSVTDTEQRLESLNRSLREVIIKVNPTKFSGYGAPPNGPNPSLEPGDTINTQFDYLEQGLRMMHEDQDIEGLREAEATAATASIALARAEIRIDTLNSQFRNLLLDVNPNYPRAPDSGGAELDDQFDYTEKCLQLVESQLASGAGQGGAESENVLMGLWELIQNGYTDVQQRREQRRRMRAEQGLAVDEEDMSGDEGLDLNEDYSLSAFSDRVQWLYSQAIKLKDQKSVLKRQIKQQRELNNKSDSAKDAELQAKQDEVEQVRIMLQHAEDEASKSQEMLSQSMKEVEDARAVREANESDAAWAQEQLQARDAKIAALESDSQAVQQRMAAVTNSVTEMEGKMGEADEEVASLKAKLAEAEQGLDTKQKEVEAAAERAREKEDEMEKLNVSLVEMKTELTIAQAELDGAYGSRKERAEEAAAIKNGIEVEKLRAETERLKDELAGALKELEGLTAETVGAEREKLDVEGRLDEALAARASLEGEVSGLRERLDAEARGAREHVAKLQEELDAERLKATPSPGPGGARSKPGAGTSMLSEQFRSMMKQERRKFQEDMREEQAKRRKLEEELQKLRRAHGPGKSPLSPR